MHVRSPHSVILREFLRDIVVVGTRLPLSYCQAGFLQPRPETFISSALAGFYRARQKGLIKHVFAWADLVHSGPICRPMCSRTARTTLGVTPRRTPAGRFGIAGLPETGGSERASLKWQRPFFGFPLKRQGVRHFDPHKKETGAPALPELRCGWLVL